MSEEAINNRIDSLIELSNSDRCNVYELCGGALSLLSLVHGPNSPQVKNFTKEIENLSKVSNLENYGQYVLHGVLQNLKGEIDAGLVKGFQKMIAGEILTDFLLLARTALDYKNENAKNVAAVLSAALFEDTIRRIASSNGISRKEKLSDVLIELKDQNVVQGTQVGIAQSYLKFRNDALHAQWENIEKESVASILGFVEQLLLKHLS